VAIETNWVCFGHFDAQHGECKLCKAQSRCQQRTTAQENIVKSAKTWKAKKSKVWHWRR
jgi:hypothetical protein